jgi:ATP-dependent Clp protease ATP-binding subunit ClpA
MQPFKNFTTKAKEAIKKAHELAIERGQNHVSPLHLVTALIHQEESLVYSVLDRLDIDALLLSDTLLETLESPESASTLSPSYQLYLTPDLANALESSAKVAAKLNDQFVGAEHLFVACLGIPGTRSMTYFRSSRSMQTTSSPCLRELKSTKDGHVVADKKFRTLAKYTRNLTKLASENALDPVIGRDQEIHRVIQILSRRTKNNPVSDRRRGSRKNSDCRGTRAANG